MVVFFLFFAVFLIVTIAFNNLTFSLFVTIWLGSVTSPAWLAYLLWKMAKKKNKG